MMNHPPQPYQIEVCAFEFSFIESFSFREDARTAFESYVRTPGVVRTTLVKTHVDPTQDYVLDRHDTGL